MRVLVAVASKHGATREIAEVIAVELRGMNLETDCLDTNDVESLDGYDAVVLGSAIYMGKWLDEARSFASTYAADLADVPVWLFSSGPLGVEKLVPSAPGEQVGQIADSLHPKEHRVFAGRLEPDDLSLGERLATKVVGAPHGDFRPWDEIAAWARTIGTEMQTGS